MGLFFWRLVLIFLSRFLVSIVLIIFVVVLFWRFWGRGSVMFLLCCVVVLRMMVWVLVSLGIGLGFFEDDRNGVVSRIGCGCVLMIL